MTVVDLVELADLAGVKVDVLLSGPHVGFPHRRTARQNRLISANVLT